MTRRRWNDVARVAAALVLIAAAVLVPLAQLFTATARS